MVCLRCSAITDKGQRCKRNTCLRYPYCYQHQKKIEGLELNQSRIPDAGKGAFATRDFPFTKQTAKKPITYYSAKNITYEPDLYSAYVLRVNNTQYLDSKNPSNFTGRYINSFKNHPDITKRNANVRFGGSQRIYQRNNRYVVPIIQKKAIKKGDELFLNYGNMYPFEE